MANQPAILANEANAERPPPKCLVGKMAAVTRGMHRHG
jgi:hypothetical protein